MEKKNRRIDCPKKSLIILLDHTISKITKGERITAIIMKKKLPIFRKDTFYHKVCMTVLVLAICAAVSAIPTPETNTDYFKALIDSNASMHFVNALTGSGLSRLSLTLMGITPYITGSIIIQLAGVISPKIKEMQKEKSNKLKMERITFLIGVFLAFIQGLAMAIGYGRQGLLLNYTAGWVILVTLIWTAGSSFLALAGKLIEKKFFGNGVSLVLLLGILSSYPGDMMLLFSTFLGGKKAVIIIAGVVVFLIALFLIFLFTTLVQLCEKRIHVNYSGRLGKNNSQQNIIPIKLCPGGVVPIIFASSLLSFPVMIANAFCDTTGGIWGMIDSGQWFDPQKPYYSIGAVLYILLIFGFSYFYTDMIFSPYEVADNLRKNGGTIPGIRPGSPTADYLKKQIRYMIAIGAAALTLIAFIPVIINSVVGISSLAFFGTSIIITVGVILDTKKKYVAESAASRYMHKVQNGGIFS